MKKYIIKGSSKGVSGVVNVSGAKNACLPLMAASILFKDKVILKIDNRVIIFIPKSELIYLKNKVKITKLLNYFLKIKKAHESAFFI